MKKDEYKYLRLILCTILFIYLLPYSLIPILTYFIVLVILKIKHKYNNKIKTKWYLKTKSNRF